MDRVSASMNVTKSQTEGTTASPNKLRTDSLPDPLAPACSPRNFSSARTSILPIQGRPCVQEFHSMNRSTVSSVNLPRLAISCVESSSPPVTANEPCNSILKNEPRDLRRDTLEASLFILLVAASMISVAQNLSTLLKAF